MIHIVERPKVQIREVYPERNQPCDFCFGRGEEKDLVMLRMIPCRCQKSKLKDESEAT